MDRLTAETPKHRVVWDPLVRVFHWLLVASVLGSLWTGFLGGFTMFGLHIWLGCAVTALIVVRVVWGFTGTTHARFRDFVASPLAILRYVRDLLGGRAPAHAGHNPLGGLMILGLLLMLAALVGSGVVGLGGVAKEGPLAPWSTYAFGTTAAGLHRLLGFLLLGMIALHIAGVLLESLRTSENLVRAMITGRKRRALHAEARAEIEAAGDTRKSRPALAAGIVMAMAAVAMPLIVTASRLPPQGVPSSPLPEVYVKECGACHSVHHPSLAPVATWRKLMAGLDDHFGETATLAPEIVAGIEALLAGNAAERFDTAAANRLAAPSRSEPLRITATDGWRQIHSGIAETVFMTKAVAGRANCGNCHGDALTGLFSRRAIRMPFEPLP